VTRNDLRIRTTPSAHTAPQFVARGVVSIPVSHLDWAIDGGTKIAAEAGAP